eukprot:jgi/Tetstr1/465186/TSEL_000858.t1
MAPSSPAAAGGIGVSWVAKNLESCSWVSCFICVFRLTTRRLDGALRKSRCIDALDSRRLAGVDYLGAVGSLYFPSLDLNETPRWRRRVELRQPRLAISMTRTAPPGALESFQVFIELDDMVQESALQHMESLGIKDCRKYISAKIDAKGQELYVEWLDSSVKFRSS